MRPGITVSVLPLRRAAAMDALVEGQADLALGFVWNPPETISGEVLYHETFLVVGRPETLPDAPRIDLDRYCAADHVLIAPGGDMRRHCRRQA